MMFGAKGKKRLFWLAVLAIWLLSILASSAGIGDNGTRSGRTWYHNLYRRKHSQHNQQRRHGRPLTRPPLDANALKSRSVVYRNYYYYNPFNKQNQTRKEEASTTASTLTTQQAKNTSEPVVQYKFAYYKPEATEGATQKTDASGTSDTEATEKVDSIFNNYVTVGLLVGVVGFLGMAVVVLYLYLSNPPTEVVTARGGRLAAVLLMANSSSGHHLADLIEALEHFDEWSPQCREQIMCEVYRRYPVIYKFGNVMDKLFRAKWIERWLFGTHGTSNNSLCRRQTFPDCPLSLQELLS